MSKVDVILNAIAAACIIPIFIFAYLGITDRLEKSVVDLDRLYDYWRQRLDGLNQDERFSELLGTYSTKVVEQLADPDEKYYKRRRKFLTSKSLDRVIVFSLVLIGLRMCVPLIYGTAIYGL